MTEVVLVFDTCVLPRRASLYGNPLLAGLIRAAQVSGSRLVLPDIVLEESVSARYRAATDAIDALQRSLAEASKYFANDDLNFYLPDASQSIEEWRQELQDVFEIIPTHGDDAREALVREARRQPPAKATSGGSATGSRDSSIWLTVKRLVSTTEDTEIHFISSNTADFASAADSKILREELLAEIPDGGGLHYHPSISAAVEVVMTSSSIEDVPTDLLDAFKIEGYLRENLFKGIVEVVPSLRAERATIASLTIIGAREDKAYTVAEGRLVLVVMDIRFSVLAEPQEAPPDELGASVRLWVHETEDDKFIDVSLIRIAT